MEVTMVHLVWYHAFVGFYFDFDFSFFFILISADKHSRPKSLNVEEEQFMRVYYEYKLREVCNAFYFPHKIQVCGSVSK